ncbi:LLM class flavin-dependent oxidoreductase [Dictyobacter formicarum]|uniref:LLM class F420-dependent oxidoreductase n=1 Tax=Dictyobacter formicarum TaxID=2778368 RepID=A0ABQ3VQ70_9CHLR|nr:LLM class flavin-dependent oxidoreductase [Dictyobacter formicarum]GHO88407.1 LLM class F420-dependent oxidoreductase [Dictyobacter formicarum]
MTTFPVGVVIFPPTSQKVLQGIKQAEQAGIPMAWVPSWPVGPDGFSIVTAAAVQTSSIGLGTGISITYPCHPLARANQALVTGELAPQRFRLGIGASHQPAIEGTYGLKFARPIGHMKEYIAVLRGMLWEGRIDLDGEYYQVHAELPPMVTPPCIPIVIAALRKNMLRLAGEVADGAMLIWSPPSYVRSVAIPNMEEGARLANRPRPPLIVSAPIVLTKDFTIVSKIAQAAFSVYSSFPTYRHMFMEAGYPLKADGTLSDELIHELFLYGDEDTIRQRLYALHEAGADEIITTINPHDPSRDYRTILEILASL